MAIVFCKARRGQIRPLFLGQHASGGMEGRFAVRCGAEDCFIRGSASSRRSRVSNVYPRDSCADRSSGRLRTAASSKGRAWVAATLVNWGEVRYDSGYRLKGHAQVRGVPPFNAKIRGTKNR